MKPFVITVGLAFSLLVLSHSGAQQTPANNLDEFEITPAAGPFAICAHGFTGVDARERAHDMAVAIRQTYKLPAYTFFVNRKEIEERQAKMDELRMLSTELGARKIAITRLEGQVSVLVRGYKE